jgi:signal transduction histidine kinase
MSEPAEPISRDFVFRPRARLVSILGEHLISDQAVGLIELVKNAYDADATEVEIELLGLGAPDTTVVIVRDNGFGMTLGDIEGKWLSPAVDHKEKDKRANRRTPMGRLPIGEKGVGRFAVQQIGRHLQLITRTYRRPETVVPVDWDRFESGDAYLDSVALRIEQREAERFLEDSTGTILEIRHARAAWTRQLLEKVHRSLRRLQSPLREKDETRFRVTLKCPEFPEFENIDPTDILDRAHYEFQGLVDSDGQCDFEYRCRHPGVATRTKSGTEQLVALAAKELQGVAPKCGPFWINLYVWDRTRDFLSQSGVSARELNAQCGVSLFRDGLRVLPYGEPGDDWLLLDQERIQDPSGRIGNNQVIGLIQVLQERNLHLRDKTNREGLIENEAFLDLKALARASMRLFATHWRKDRPRDENAKRTRTGSLEAARDLAAALKTTAREDVAVQVPLAATSASAGAPAPAEQEVGPETSTVSQRKAVEILIDNIDGATATARDRELRMERLLTLAATGLAAERVVHEFGRQVTASQDALAGLSRTLRGNAPAAHAVDILDTCLGTLRNEFRILAPYESTGGMSRTRDFSIGDAVALAMTLNRRFLDEQKVKVTVEGDDFQVKGRAAAVVQILDNLVHNASYWLGTMRPGPPRRLLVSLDGRSSRVIVADNGPGIAEEAQAHLFEPFFTLKAGGTGLGLYISHEIAKRMSGDIRTAKAGDDTRLPVWATGAVFVVSLPPAGGKPQ